jgi:hypothetical protein
VSRMLKSGAFTDSCSEPDNVYWRSARGDDSHAARLPCDESREALCITSLKGPHDCGEIHLRGIIPRGADIHGKYGSRVLVICLECLVAVRAGGHHPQIWWIWSIQKQLRRYVIGGQLFLLSAVRTNWIRCSHMTILSPATVYLEGNYPFSRKM